METRNSENDIPLLMALPLLYKLIMSSADLKQFGFTKTQMIILTSLAMHDKLRMSQIADYISSSKEQATRAVATLVDIGYIARIQEPENRTRVYVRLTEPGRMFLDQWRTKFLKNLYKNLDDHIPPEEQAELQQAANCIVRILGKLK